MPQRNVATNFTFEQQRQEINLLASDFWTQKGTVDTAASTYLKHDGSNNFTGGTLNVPNAFTINANSGSGTLTISGNLDVTGTTTTVNTANLEVTDKNILIAKGSTSDAQADGAGITIDSATDITFNFVDANDALVSSIGLEGTTFVKAPYGQFTGSGTPSGGQGVEINAPDTNTGQIISYDRANTAYKELRVKGSSVGVYTGTSNALVGSFNSTGLTMESGKTITGNVTGDLTGTASKVELTSESASATAFRVPFASANSGSVDLYADNSDGITYKPSDGTLSVQKLEGTIVTAAQGSITSVGTLTGLDLSGDVSLSKSGVGVVLLRSTDNDMRVRIRSIDGKLSQLEFADDDADAGEIRYGHADGSTIPSDYMSFHVGANDEKLRITSDGKVGINDNDPELTLHVKDGDLSGRSAANTNCDVLIEGETNTGIQFYSGTQVQLRFGDAASTAAGAIIYQHSDDQFKFNYDTNGFITFNSGGGGETLRITNDKVMTSVDIKPDTHQQRDIGTASNSFKDIYSKTLYDSKGEIRKIIIKANSTNNYNLISSDAGKAIHSSADVVVPNAVFSAGDAITLINSSQSNMSIAQATNVTMYNSADGSTGNRTLSGKGMATLYWIDSSTCYISGAGLS